MWNYRVVRKKNTWIDPEDKKEKVNYTYAIHEAYYDKKGYVGSITQEPVEPFGENIEELRNSWVMMAEAFGQPILNYDNIPEPGYRRKEDPLGSILDERLKEHEIGRVKKAGIPWEELKKELEEKWGPFDHETYRNQVEQERIEKERIHIEVFTGTPIIKDLIDKIYSDYEKWIKENRVENPCKYTTENA